LKSVSVKYFLHTKKLKLFWLAIWSPKYNLTIYFYKNITKKLYTSSVYDLEVV
jgi:hypothetical protein